MGLPPRLSDSNVFTVSVLDQPNVVGHSKHIQVLNHIVFILGILIYIWKSIFAATVNYDLASAEGMKPDVSNFIFTQWLTLR